MPLVTLRRPRLTPAPGYRAEVSEPAARPARRMLRAALRPRMLALLVLFLAAAAVCGMLGAWQLDRAEVRGARAAAERIAAAEAAEPVPIENLLQPQTTFDGALVGRRVVAQGNYEGDEQLLVPDRVHDGRTGYLVLTPLRVDRAGDDDPVLPVVRGWVEDPDDAAALTPAEGPVTVTGFLQASEDSGAGMHELPAGQTDAVSSAELLGLWGGPIWTGYVVLSESDPVQDSTLELLPLPTRSGSGLNIQNLAYAAQWWIFGGFAIFLWIRLLRDEADLELVELTDDPDADDPGGPAGPDDPAGPEGLDAVPTSPSPSAPSASGGRPPA